VSKEKKSLGELKALKRRWYDEALAVGTLNELGFITRQLGCEQNSSYGPKYKLCWNKVTIFVDDYGHYMTVHVHDKLVCSTHPTEHLFVPGDWTEVLTANIQEAKAKASQTKAERDERERAILARQLGLE
jgi:hypothetical protein